MTAAGRVIQIYTFIYQGGERMTTSVIVSAVRTPIGSFQGSLTSFKVTELGGMAIKEVINRAGIEPSAVQEVIMGCVLPAGLGQAPARQAMIAAGLPYSTGALTVNKVCSSGLMAVAIADKCIKTGDCDIAVAGGMESMTNSPYILPKGRFGYRMGDGKIVDTMVFDGLWDIYNNIHMGACAEMCAKKYHITREEQDAFAIASYKKAMAAQESGLFKDEMMTVSIPQKKGEPISFNEDEEVKKVNFDKLPKLAPAFEKDGTVTAANSSSISDGAAALLVMSEKKAKELGLKPLARIIAHAGFSQEPEWFTTAPVGATKRVLEKAGLKKDSIDLFEANEAFSVQVLAYQKELGIDPNKLNIHGGAVAIGHPIGCSGARIIVTLLHGLKHKGLKRGLATLCNGGGEATAMVLEMI